MEYLSEDQFKLLLSKEWLVKIDSEHSIPYLLKYYSSKTDPTCCIMVTDTQTVWGEVLSSKQIARRWRQHNPEHSSTFSTLEEEDEWRAAILELISASHTLGGVMDLTFEVVGSHFSDFAFELGSDTFKWRWETYALGPKASAEILSKQLIIPLISVTHLAFSSADPVSELSEADLEKAVDKVGRTARRTFDTHVKHAISRPRVATTLRRMTATFNLLPDLPSIVTDTIKPDLTLPPAQLRPPAPLRPSEIIPSRPLSTDPPSKGKEREPVATPAAQPRSSETTPSGAVISDQTADESVTEDEDEDEDQPAVLSKTVRGGNIAGKPTRGSPSPSRSGSRTRASPQPFRQHTPEQKSTPNRNATQDLTTADSSPSPPAKRTKRTEVPSSDDDSEAERKKQVARLKSSSNRGAKQPLKRGGRRF